MTSNSHTRDFLKAGDALFESGYFDEAEFFYSKVLERDCSPESQTIAAGRLLEICTHVKREDDTERFGQLYRELIESRAHEKNYPRLCN